MLACTQQLLAGGPCWPLYVDGLAKPEEVTLCRQQNSVQPPIPQTCTGVVRIAVQSALLSSGFHMVFGLVLFLNAICMNYIFRLFSLEHFVVFLGCKKGKKQQGYNCNNPLPSSYAYVHLNLSNIFIKKIFPRKLHYHYSAIIYLYFVLVKLINLSKLLSFKSLRCFFFIIAIWISKMRFFPLTEFCLGCFKNQLRYSSFAQRVSKYTVQLLYYVTHSHEAGINRDARDI